MTGNCFVGGSYRGLLSLVRHSNNDGSVGIFWIIVSAVCHLRTLQITGYFGKEDKSTKSTLGGNQLFIGGVLVDILQLLRYNTHSILEQVVRIFNKSILEFQTMYKSLIRYTSRLLDKQIPSALLCFLF